ncbi:type II toxin-antitoxin system RelE/ParE family toxin [Desulfovibrio sp. OttesenSCG-928-M16]|nr:type II toxin-antitoxin system RelE/ParE family toxin [Desulfovibrio sp. OttesenSCG-928-M16]
MYNYNIEWTAPAWDDVDEISNYLIEQEDDFQVADDMVARILQAPEHLSSLPWSGKPGRLPDTRELRVQKTRYSLVYAVSDMTVFILRVMHSSRLFPPAPEQDNITDE